MSIAWSTQFKTTWQRRALYFALPYAYRPPTLFASRAAVELGALVEVIALDEHLSATLLNAGAEASDILYICAHGQFRNHEYRATLHHDDWYPSRMYLGSRGPSVAIFDTCNLLDSKTWPVSGWLTGLGPNLRLVLGFASVAPMDSRSTERAIEFVDRLVAGDGLGTAWLRAVHTIGPSRAVAAALAIGDWGSDHPLAEPTAIIERATLDDLPFPPTLKPYAGLKLCH